MYQAGDAVAHPGHGGCIISEVRTVIEQGNEIKYLVLRPQGEEDILIYIPLSKAGGMGLRAVMSEAKADDLLSSFSEPAIQVSEASSFLRRSVVYRDIVQGESLERLASLIRELTAKAKLCMNDKAMLSRAEKRLFSEIALVKGIPFCQILQMAQSRMSARVAAV